MVGALIDHPWLLSLVSFLLIWLAGQLGFQARQLRLVAGARQGDGLDQVRRATFTLLSVLIGFSLSMAVARYDTRKVNEEEEANAIGTEFLRLDLLPGAETAQIRSLLHDYGQQRILFFTAADAAAWQRANSESDRLQQLMWTPLSAAAIRQPSPLSALAVSGMNDVINAAGYSMAALYNRLPLEVWGLTLFVATCASVFAGFGAERRSNPTLLVSPLLVAIAFLLIADTDSPRSGLVRVQSQNLLQVLTAMENSAR